MVNTHSCQWFQLAQTLESNSLPKMSVHPFSSVVQISSNTREWLTPWMYVHPFMSHNQLKYMRVTHTLDADSHVLISGYDSIKHWRATHTLNACLPNLVRGSDSLNIGEQLTRWMHVHPFSSGILIWSNTSDHSQSGCMFTHFCQWFWSGQTLESDSHSGHMFIHSSQ